MVHWNVHTCTLFGCEFPLGVVSGGAVLALEVAADESHACDFDEAACVCGGYYCNNVRLELDVLVKTCGFGSARFGEEGSVVGGDMSSAYGGVFVRADDVRFHNKVAHIVAGVDFCDKLGVVDVHGQVMTLGAAHKDVLAAFGSHARGA